MKIIAQDLINLFEKNPSTEEVSSKLFQLGHENEIDKGIFHMELTPNRGDCFSLYGIARDLNYFYGPVKDIHIYDKEIDKLSFNFNNLCKDICQSISFLEIEINEKIDEYMPYLENYFVKMQINKTNFFTDVSNYISYELGQPTHCYDREKLGKDLVLKYLESSTKFKTLMGNEIDLQEKDCVFTIDNEVINLAGVMGGISTACSPQTRKVLVECAYFEPESIIGKTQKYNLVSNAAYKFERGVDMQSHEKVLRRFIKIVSDHAEIISVKIKSYEEVYPEKKLKIDVNKVNSILGTHISEEYYLNLLRSIGFIAHSEIIVPSYRHDIQSQNDLSEEVARLIGYNNISSHQINLPKTKDKNKDISVNLLRDHLVKSGFNEIINFPFDKDETKDSFKIDNPLDSNKNNLRTSLKDSLIENLLYNERRQKDSLKLFEISNVYRKDSDYPSPKEILKVGIIATGRVGHNYKDFSKKIDKAFLMNSMEEIMDINANIEEIPRDILNTKHKSRIFYVEIELEVIEDKIKKNKLLEEKRFNFQKYIDISDFPSSSRDFSFLISDPSKYLIFMDLIENIDGSNVKNAFIFDYFKNDDLKQIKVGIRIIFKSDIKTLSEEEINQSAESIIKPFLSIDGVSIPGLEYNK